MSVVPLSGGPIAVAEAATLSTYRVDAGSPVSYLDTSGNTYSADQYFSGGYPTSRGSIAIAGTSNPALFRTERWGLSNYTFPMVNGRYLVQLYFAETYGGITRAGQRVFGVSVHGTSLGSIDVFAETGGRNRALVKSVTVDVADGQMPILFTAITQNPMINAVIIVPEPAVAVCTSTLQLLVDQAVPGSVVKVPACVYRETVTINKSLTLDGQPGAQIRGSDVWAAWSQSGARYVSQLTVPVFSVVNDTNRCRASANGACLWPEQVFFDGRPLIEVAAGTTPATGQFALLSANDRHVALGDNPSGHILEVTTRTSWVQTQSNNVTIQGFTMKHSANDGQTGAIGSNFYSGWILQDSTLSDAHGYVVNASGGTNNRVLRNDISRGGQMGIAGYQANGALIQANKIHDNNTANFNTWWEAGASKFSASVNLTLDNNEVYNNDGPGLWCDLDCQSITWSNNRVHNNTEYGMLFEISDGAKIFGNTVWENGWTQAAGWTGGIFSSNSTNVEVYNNVLAWNADGLVSASQARTDSPAGNETHLSFHDNIVVSTSDTNNPCGMCWWSNDAVMFAAGSQVSSNANALWWPGAEGSAPRFAWNGNITSLVAFNATNVNTDQYLTTTAKSQVLTAAGIPSMPLTHPL